MPEKSERGFVTTPGSSTLGTSALGKLVPTGQSPVEALLHEIDRDASESVPPAPSPLLSVAPVIVPPTTLRAEHPLVTPELCAAVVQASWPLLTEPELTGCHTPEMQDVAQLV